MLFFPPTSKNTLFSQLSTQTFPRPMLPMNQLTYRFDQPAISPLKKILHSKKTPAFQKIHGLWVLHRLNALDEKNLSAAAADQERGVRVHAMRVLSETASWTPAQRDLVLTGLRDSDPYVER